MYRSTAWRSPWARRRYCSVILYKRGPAVTKRAEGEPRYIACSTYRLQLNSFFTFPEAAALLDYLQDLGITDCYTSPFLMARPRSLHGYDVTDHKSFNPEIGTHEQFQHFADQLKLRGMGLIVDVV